MQITNGPFAGVCAAEDEIRTIYDRDGQAVVRDGVVLKTWGVHQRTPYFLDKYPPHEGWGVEVVHAPGGFDLPDPELWVPDGNGGTRMGTNPTVLFTARLVNPEGRVLGSASYLKLVNSITSHQEGETLARGKLYDALGLLGSSGSFGASDAAPPPTERRADASEVPAAPMAIPTTDSRHTKLLPVAQALIEAHAGKAASAAAPENAIVEPESDVTDGTGQPASEATEVTTTDAPAQSTVDDVAPVATAAPTAAPVPASTAPAKPVTHAKNGDVLNANLLRQAENRARLQGIILPVFNDSEHLRSFYRDLCTKRQAP